MFQHWHFLPKLLISWWLYCKTKPVPLPSIYVCKIYFDSSNIRKILRRRSWELFLSIMLEIQYSILHGVFQNLQKRIFRTCGTLAYYNKNIQTQFIVNLEIKRKIFVYEPLVIIIQCARYQFLICLCIWCVWNP